MSAHISAKKGEIAETVLLPGDPLRAKFMAEDMLNDVICYNEIRGMFGYTGKYNGKKVSIQGGGMGIPSNTIYIHELIQEYDVKNIIRIGTCGSIQPDIQLGEVILVISGSSDSNTNRIDFNGLDFAPSADFALLRNAAEKAEELGIKTRVGGIFSTDTFYNSDPERWKIWTNHNVLGVEMETSALYTLGARFNVATLSILTVSDSIVNKEYSSAETRENSFTDMVKIALEIAPES